MKNLRANKPARHPALGDQMLKRPPVPSFLPLDTGILTLGMLEYQTAPS